MIHATQDVRDIRDRLERVDADPERQRAGELEEREVADEGGDRRGGDEPRPRAMGADEQAGAPGQRADADEERDAERLAVRVEGEQRDEQCGEAGPMSRNEPEERAEEWERDEELEVRVDHVPPSRSRSNGEARASTRARIASALA